MFDIRYSIFNIEYSLGFYVMGRQAGLLNSIARFAGRRTGIIGVLCVHFFGGKLKVLLFRLLKPQ